MDIRSNVMVPLGYGKYAKADKIIALDPIEEESQRGPGRRTRVYIEGLKEPIIGSRTERSILRDMVETPEESLRAHGTIELIEDLLEDLREIGPMLRRSIRDEAGLDIDAIERRIVDVLDAVPDQ